jgi:hypothetical protein
MGVEEPNPRAKGPQMALKGAKGVQDGISDPHRVNGRRGIWWAESLLSDILDSLSAY